MFDKDQTYAKQPAEWPTRQLGTLAIIPFSYLMLFNFILLFLSHI